MYMTKEEHSRLRATYGGIGTLAELLELLEGAGVTLVHGGYALAAAETAYADGRVGAVVERKSTDVGRMESLVGRVAVRVARIPENGAGRRQLAGNIKR